jgi:dihydrodipicolinate synthase/N-acetylneuraminate lyase
MLLFCLLLLIFPFLNAFSAVKSSRIISAGSYVALVTPMNAAGDIDYKKFINLLNWHVNEGTNGLVIIGTTGEGSMIDINERSKLIQTAMTTVNGKIPVIVGTGTIETSKVIDLCRKKFIYLLFFLSTH